jgi:hypothetical protein
MFTSSDRSEAKRGNFDGTPSGFSGSGNFSCAGLISSMAGAGGGIGGIGIAGAATPVSAAGFCGCTGPCGGTTGVPPEPACCTGVLGAADGVFTGWS